MFSKESVQTGIGFFNMLERIEPKMISQSPLCLNENVKSISNCKNKKETICCTLLKKNPNSSCPFESDYIIIIQYENSNIFSPLQCYKSLISIHFRNYNQREVVTKENTEESINIYIYIQTIPSRVNVLF